VLRQKVGIDQVALDHLRRFLDVTKASLLFARGVILVEGIAEQLLLPEMAKRVDVSLSEAGIAIVNVGGVSFAPFASLFSSERLPFRCAVISDGDPPSDAFEFETEGGEPLLSVTARKLKESETDTMHVFLATKTFEWDLARSGNWEPLLEALALIKPKTAEGLRNLGPDGADERADAVLAAVKDVKGPLRRRHVWLRRPTRTSRSHRFGTLFATGVWFSALNTSRARSTSSCCIASSTHSVT
jgi:putative ATP-dependent endonuclease of OLD family